VLRAHRGGGVAILDHDRGEGGSEQGQPGAEGEGPTEIKQLCKAEPRWDACTIHASCGVLGRSMRPLFQRCIVCCNEIR
jgi:hypothetical protein